MLSRWGGRTAATERAIWAAVRQQWVDRRTTRTAADRHHDFLKLGRQKAGTRHRLLTLQSGW